VIHSKAALSGSAYFSMFFLGVGNAIVGAAAGNIGLTAYQIGLLLAAQNLGFFGSVVTAGALADNVEKPRLLLAGSILTCVAFFLFYLWQPFLLNVLIMFFIGAAMGVSEGVTDAMLLELHEKRQAFHVGINHFSVTVGGLLITGYLVFLQMSWRRALVQSAAAVLILAAFLVFAGAGTRRKDAGRIADRLRFLGSRRVVPGVLAAAIIFVGIETGLTGLLTTFLLRLRDYDQTSSKLGLILFLAGIALGRAFFGLIARRERIRGMLFALIAACGLFSTLLFLLPLPPVANSATLLMLGLSVSALFPLVITMTGLLFPEMSGTAIGVVKLGVPIGGILVPLIVGSAARLFSFQGALLAFPVLAVAGLIVVLLTPAEVLYD
jgi:MFS family permease